MATASLTALSATELRRRIGTKEISPVELLEACIERIEALNPAVNAIAATAYDRARAEAKAAEAGGAARRAARPPARPADRHQGPRGDGGPAHHVRLAALSRPRADATIPRMVALVRGRGRRRRRPRPTCRSSAPAPTRATRCGAPPAIRSTRRLNAGGSSGGSAVALACDMLPRLHRLRHRRIAAHPGRDLRRGRLPAVARRGADGWRGSSAGHRSRCWARWAARSPTRCLLFAAQIGVDDRDPLSFRWPPTRHRRPLAGRSRPPARRLDRGFRPVPGQHRDPRRHARAHRGDAPSVPQLRRGRLRLRRGRPLLRRDPRAELRRRYQDAYDQGSQARSGPTSAPTTRSAPR